MYISCPGVGGKIDTLRRLCFRFGCLYSLGAEWYTIRSTYPCTIAIVLDGAYINLG